MVLVWGCKENSFGYTRHFNPQNQNDKQWMVEGKPHNWKYMKK
jgi:hypothetical protein